MSIYTVTGNGPCIASQSGDAMSLGVVNTGSRPVFLSDNPGIYTYGFQLAPGGSHDWAPNTPLYLQCNPGDTTKVSVGEAGVTFTPSVLNTPSLSFFNFEALCASGSRPLGGAGDQFISSAGGSDTPFIDCTNYNSVIVTCLEDGLGGAGNETRDVTLNWYTTTDLGNRTFVYKECFRYYAIGQSATRPQLAIHTPCKGSFLVVTIGVTTYGVSPAVVNKLSTRIIGDSRVLSAPIALINANYWVVQELAVPFVSEDMSGTTNLGGNQTGNKFSGTMLLPVGSTFFSFSSRSGPCKWLSRINPAAPIANTGTRFQIIDKLTSDPLYATNFDRAPTGIVYDTQEIFLPYSPCRLQMVNNTAAPMTVFTAITPQNH